MSEKPISLLRRRMIEDMTVRNFVEKTRNDYIRHVRTFTTFLGRAGSFIEGFRTPARRSTAPRWHGTSRSCGSSATMDQLGVKPMLAMSVSAS